MTRDEKYLLIATAVAAAGTCDRLLVGCIIVGKHGQTAIGWNTSVDGHGTCEDYGHLLNTEGRCIRTVHAEQNALLRADPAWLRGATAYVTHEPCETCTKLLNQAGIERVVFKRPYANPYNYFFRRGMVWEQRDDDRWEQCDYCLKPLDKHASEDHYIESEGTVLCSKHYNEWRQRNEPGQDDEIAQMVPATEQSSMAKGIRAYTEASKL